MKHDCGLINLQVYEDEDGYFYVKERCSMPFGRHHTFPIEYCPVCGTKAKKSHIAHVPLFKRTDIPDSTPEPLHVYQSMMVQAINDMNRNIESIKAFMISQNTQNQCFIDRDCQVSQDICKLERHILNLEKTIMDKGKS